MKKTLVFLNRYSYWIIKVVLILAALFFVYRLVISVPSLMFASGWGLGLGDILLPPLVSLFNLLFILFIFFLLYPTILYFLSKKMIFKINNISNPIQHYKGYLFGMIVGAISHLFFSFFMILNDGYRQFLLDNFLSLAELWDVLENGLIALFPVFIPILILTPFLIVYGIGYKIRNNN